MTPMPEERYTRCPSCKTVFRVTPAQLALREGQVRCGHCRAAFDGVAAQISLAPQPSGHPRYAFEDDALGPPTVTLRHAHALEPGGSPGLGDAEVVASREDATAQAPDKDRASVSTEDGGLAEDSGSTEAAGAPAEEASAAELAYAARFAWQDEKKHTRVPAWAYISAVLVLALGLAAQAAYHFRDSVVAFWPAAKPALSSLCASLGCRVSPLQNIAMLSIEASDLQADPAHKGLLVLTATLRNRAAHAVSYPHLELTLTDTRDRVVVRRVLSPAEFASGTADLDAGVAAGGELGVKVFIDASATSQAGYKIYLFYP